MTRRLGTRQRFVGGRGWLPSTILAFLQKFVVNEAMQGFALTSDPRQMSSDIPEASKYLNRSIMHAEDIGFREGVKEASAALKRLQSLSKR